MLRILVNCPETERDAKEINFINFHVSHTFILSNFRRDQHCRAVYVEEFDKTLINVYFRSRIIHIYY